MKPYATIVTLLLLLACFGWYITYDLLRDLETSSEAMKSVLTVQLEQAAAKTKRETARADSIQAAEKTFRDSLVKVGNKREEAFKKDLKASRDIIKVYKQERKLAGITPDSATLKIEAEFEAQQARDSIERATLIQTHNLAEVSYNRELKAVTDKYEATRDESLKKDAVITHLEKDLRKEKKKGKVFKWLAIIGFGLAIEESIRN